MKKLSILSLIVVMTTFLMVSCKNKYEAKKSDLSNQNDSLNYTLGLVNGEGIKNYYLQNDSSDKPIEAFMNALDKAYKSKKTDKWYQLGYQIGTSLKFQESHGLMADTTLAFNTKLVKQGIINALYNFDGGMSPQQAQEYLQKTMYELQAKKASEQALPSVPEKDSTLDTLNTK